MAVITARLMRRRMFKVDETPFVMELPPYRVPTMKATVSHMWEKCAQYLRKMGGLILVASIIVWFLSYYPRQHDGEPAETHYENSYIGRVGKFCEPVFEPIGLNWKASVSIVSGIAAKEIMVSTIGVLYADSDMPVAEGEPEKSATLHEKLVASRRFRQGVGTRHAGIHAALFPVPRHGNRTGIRKRMEMGFGFDGVQYGGRMALRIRGIPYSESVHTMNWQDIAVGVIGIAIVAIVVTNAMRRAKRPYNPCDGCAGGCDTCREKPKEKKD